MLYYTSDNDALLFYTTYFIFGKHGLALFGLSASQICQSCNAHLREILIEKLLLKIFKKQYFFKIIWLTRWTSNERFLFTVVAVSTKKRIIYHKWDAFSGRIYFYVKKINRGWNYLPVTFLGFTYRFFKPKQRLWNHWKHLPHKISIVPNSRGPELEKNLQLLEILHLGPIFGISHKKHCK